LVQVDGRSTHLIASNDVVSITDVPPGSHSVQLIQLPVNCSVQGDNPRTVDVAPDVRTDVTFALSCFATTGVLQLTTITSGFDGPNIVTIAVDDQAPRTVAPSSRIWITGAAGGAH